MAGKALLVLGMTRTSLDPEAERPIREVERLVEAVAGEIAYFRERRRPVVFVVPGHEQLPQGELIAQVLPELKPDSLDICFAMDGISAFHRSGLDRWLTEQEIEGLTLVGVRSHVEVLFTAADAFQRGLSLVVPAPCVASDEPEDHAFALRQIREVLSG